MSISKETLLNLFYECDSWYALNSGNESVDLKELIEKLKVLYEKRRQTMRRRWKND